MSIYNQHLKGTPEEQLLRRAKVMFYRLMERSYVEDEDVIKWLAEYNDIESRKERRMIS